MLVLSTYICGKLYSSIENLMVNGVESLFLFKKKSINTTPFIRLLSILTVRATAGSLRQGRKCTIKLFKPERQLAKTSLS